MTQRLSKTAVIAAIAVAVAGCEARDAGPAGDANQANTASADARAANGVPLAKAAADASLQWGACPAPFPTGCEMAVLHGDPAKPNADVFLRVPGGYAIPPHSHSSAERMILVSGTLQVKYQGHPETTLQTGSYAFGPAGLPHRGSCAAGTACTLFIAFEGPVDVEPFSGAIE
jgi:mannose-6-phosphate isomerase-like protein (cupin superfamily)